MSSPYDAIARLYDPWSLSVTEDIEFYVEEALASGGPIVELGCRHRADRRPGRRGRGRGDRRRRSHRMLDVARERAGAAGVEELVDLRLGDLREPPVTERVPLVTCPFRSLLHMTTETDASARSRAVHELLLPGGRLVFDVFAPSPDDVEATHGRWLEREPGIFERADWDEGERTLTLSVRRGEEALDDAARLALGGRVAPAARARGLRGRGALRLVRPAALRGRGGLRLRR